MKFTSLTKLPQVDLSEKVTKAHEALKDDELLQNNALLRFHYPFLDVDKLTDDEWAYRVAELHWVLLKENILQKKND